VGPPGKRGLRHSYPLFFCFRFSLGTAGTVPLFDWLSEGLFTPSLNRDDYSASVAGRHGTRHDSERPINARSDVRRNPSLHVRLVARAAAENWMVLRISLVYGGREFRSRVTAEMIEVTKLKRAEERAAALRSAEATLRRIGEQDTTGFYVDLL